MNGIINVYKEQGYTSFDVIARLRGILNMKKIGHTGTLDPDAVGVLPVCLGKATKLCDLITDWDKTYEVVMLLGTVTDTLDISGKILAKNEVDVTDIQVCETINSYIGDYDQIPPMYSALKINGKRLYQLAREGIEVERKARRVNIHSIHINEMNLQDDDKTVTFTVECSKGTYIRSLCDDIGRDLGCGACMLRLTRKRVGIFGIDDTLTLAQIEHKVELDDLTAFVKGIDEIFPTYEKLSVGEEFNKLLYNGNKLPEYTTSRLSESQVTLHDDVCYDAREPEVRYRLYDSHGEFVGIYKYDADMLVPVKMFYNGDRDDNE